MSPYVIATCGMYYHSQIKVPLSQALVLQLQLG